MSLELSIHGNFENNLIHKVARLTSPKCYYKNAVSVDVWSEPYMCLLYGHLHKILADLTVVLKHLQKLKNKPRLFHLFAIKEWESSMKRTEVCVSGKLMLMEIYISQHL